MILSRRLKSLALNFVGTLTHVATKEPVAALTFDDGPHPESTPRLLEILSRHRVKATFFMLGKLAEQHPDLVRRVAEAGHVIGNHSWDHASFPVISGRERRAQIRACSAAIAPYGQNLFRPPYGEQTLASRLDALWLRHSVVTWNVDGEDWRGTDADGIATRLASLIREGSIVVLHDSVIRLEDGGFSPRESSLQGLQIYLEQTGDRFQFVTVPDLLRHGQPKRKIWILIPNHERLNRLRNEYANTGRNAAGMEDR
jgi:peptidoglycan/xylan/chitin deacetylase (PgdA/CDA1 family)